MSHFHDGESGTSPRHVHASRTRPRPAGHTDLLDRPLPAVLTTHMPGGRLQSMVVWCQREGGHLLVNTTPEFQKAHNMLARPRATVLAVGPGPDNRWIEVRAGRAGPPRCRRPPRRPGARLHRHGAVLRRRAAAELAAVEHPIVFRLEPVADLTGPAWSDSRPVLPGAEPPDGPRWTCGGEPPIPPSHRYLLERPLPVELSTRMPDGSA